MNEKIPCIICNSSIWNIIKPYLLRWNYIISDNLSYDWGNRNLLVINADGDIGLCTNINISGKSLYNRELVYSVDEFLSRVAKLSNNFYTSDDSFSKSKLKPGMIVKFRNGNCDLVITIGSSNKIMLLGLGDNWSDLNNFTDNLFCMYSKDFDIIEVYNSIDDVGSLNQIITQSVENIGENNLLWRREESLDQNEKAIRRFTKKDISDILGIPIDEFTIED